MATHTCRKAGARDKHTGDVETTPFSARGEEERLEQALGKRPEERTGPLDSAIQARHRQSGGRPTSTNCKRKPPGGKNLCRTPTKHHGATTTPKEKVRGKMGGKLPSRRTTTHKGSRQQGGNRGGRTPKGEHLLSPPRANHRQHPRSRSPRGNQAGAG